MRRPTGRIIGTARSRAVPDGPSKKAIAGWNPTARTSASVAAMVNSTGMATTTGSKARRPAGVASRQCRHSATRIKGTPVTTPTTIDPLVMSW